MTEGLTYREREGGQIVRVGCPFGRRGLNATAALIQVAGWEPVLAQLVPACIYMPVLTRLGDVLDGRRLHRLDALLLVDPS